MTTPQRPSPQDLTQEDPNFLSIPDDDCVKKYQRNPELWPVEFFVIVYRHCVNPKTAKKETQIHSCAEKFQRDSQLGGRNRSSRYPLDGG